MHLGVCVCRHTRVSACFPRYPSFVIDESCFVRVDTVFVDLCVFELVYVCIYNKCVHVCVRPCAGEVIPRSLVQAA